MYVETLCQSGSVIFDAETRFIHQQQLHSSRREVAGTIAGLGNRCEADADAPL
jgi:hypothetical protein